MLYATPALDRDDQQVLAEIDAFYAAFVQSTGGAKAGEWVGGVRRRLFAGAIRGSNTIEGYTVSQTHGHRDCRPARRRRPMCPDETPGRPSAATATR